MKVTLNLTLEWTEILFITFKIYHFKCTFNPSQCFFFEFLRQKIHKLYRVIWVFIYLLFHISTDINPLIDWQFLMKLKFWNQRFYLNFKGFYWYLSKIIIFFKTSIKILYIFLLYQELFIFYLRIVSNKIVFVIEIRIYFEDYISFCFCWAYREFICF